MRSNKRLRSLKRTGGLWLIAVLQVSWSRGLLILSPCFLATGQSAFLRVVHHQGILQSRRRSLEYCWHKSTQQMTSPPKRSVNSQEMAWASGLRQKDHAAHRQMCKQFSSIITQAALERLMRRDRPGKCTRVHSTVTRQH